MEHIKYEIDKCIPQVNIVTYVLIFGENILSELVYEEIVGEIKENIMSKKDIIDSNETKTKLLKAGV